jgi:hypothetical protein
MAAPDPHPATKRILRATARVGLLLLSVTLAGCAAPSPRPHDPSPAATPAPVAAATPAPTPAPASTPATPEQVEKAEKKDILVEIEPGGEKGDGAGSLAEAARAERERRAQAAPSKIVINDKNLHRYPKESTKKGQAKPGAAAAPAETPGGEVQDEAYWRSRALEIRLRWRHAADDAKDLEQTAAGWRRRFYAEKDPNVRNGQIKPEWDRVLDRLQRARAEVESAKKDLADFLEEGRVAGALPGWLREGVDQEPKDEPPPSNEHKVIEPPKADESAIKPPAAGAA